MRNDDDEEDYDNEDEQLHGSKKRKRRMSFFLGTRMCLTQGDMCEKTSDMYKKR